MAARKSRAKKGNVKVNFKGVESRKTPAEGDYILEVLEATSDKSGAGNEQIAFTLEIAEGEYKGQKLWFYCPLAENSLWKLHAFLNALGVDPGEDEFEIDLPELVGKQVVGVLTHETYQGKKRAKMTDFDHIDNFDGEREGGKKGKKKDKDKKADKDEAKGDKKKPKDKEPAEDKKADKKGAKDKDAKTDKKKAPKKYDESDVEDMDEDELEKVVEKAGIDVDLDDIKKLPKKRAAVIKALKKAKLLEE